MQDVVDRYSKGFLDTYSGCCTIEKHTLREWLVRHPHINGTPEEAKTWHFHLVPRVDSRGHRYTAQEYLDWDGSLPPGFRGSIYFRDVQEAYRTSHREHTPAVGSAEEIKEWRDLNEFLEGWLSRRLYDFRSGEIDG